MLSKTIAPSHHMGAQIGKRLPVPGHWPLFQVTENGGHTETSSVMIPIHSLSPAIIHLSEMASKRTWEDRRIPMECFNGPDSGTSWMYDLPLGQIEGWQENGGEGRGMAELSVFSIWIAD